MIFEQAEFNQIACRLRLICKRLEGLEIRQLFAYDFSELRLYKQHRTIFKRNTTAHVFAKLKRGHFALQVPRIESTLNNTQHFALIVFNLVVDNQHQLSAFIEGM